MTLSDVVDGFVVVEAGETFTGLKRDRVFDQHPEFVPYNINYIFLDKLPGVNAWENEYYQRNQIMQGIKMADQDDLILISDTDEIPNPSAIRQDDFAIYKQQLYYYYANCLQNQIWYGTIGVKKKFIDTPQQIRDRRGTLVNVVDNGGWHYSFLGGYERIRNKLHSFSEQQVNTPAVNNETNIKKCLETGEDIFHRESPEFQKRFTNIEDSDHYVLKEWLKIYPYMAK
jgi:beta-1,4-mannosyl-glycoprotein beta-1,4-N-acetylglucosaminyltransferase